MLDSLVMMRQVMEIVVIKIHKKLSNDAHWMCSDMYSDKINGTTLGGVLRRMCPNRMTSTVRNSVEGISLHSDVFNIWI